MGRFTALALGLLLAASCRQPTAPPGHRVPPAPPQRSAATGLTFPLDPPSPTPLVAVPTFPKLSFRRPVFLTYAPNEPDRIYVLEQAGRVLAFDRRDEAESADVFLDIREQVRMRHNEEGLLGLAFAPDYADSGHVYIYYSASRPRRVQLSRFTASGGRADPGSEVPLLAVEQPYGNHNGGMIAFGPDGYLYVGLGDGGWAGDPVAAGQDLGQLLAKILRIEVTGQATYQVPADNPFVDTPGARPEIWALGLRNPWRFSFDRQTGRLWVGDVGQDKREEVDIVVRGGNYGWRAMEGTREFGEATPGPGPYIEPVVEYGRRAGESITGGYVYRGTELPGLRGAYFYGDYVTGTVWALVHDGERLVSNEVVARVPALSSFGEDAHGELYAVSLDGPIYRFAPARQRDAAPAFPTRLSQTGLFEDTATLAPNPGLLPYEVNVELWSDGAAKRRWLVLPQGERVKFTADDAWEFPVGTVVVKHFEWPERRLETRVMVHEKTGWSGYTYRWNAAQTDADLVGSPHSAALDGRTWAFPAGSDCLRCHTGSYGPILGLRTRQLNRPGADGKNQLVAWSALGVFDRAIGDAASLPAHPQIQNDAAPVAARARAYLDVNCAVCHHKGGPAPGSVDLRVQTPLRETALVAQRPEEGIGLPGERRILAGHHGSSSLWGRMMRRDEDGMPPLASNAVDKAGADLIARFVDGLRPATAGPGAPASPRR